MSLESNTSLFGHRIAAPAAAVDAIYFPRGQAADVEQDQEWCEVEVDGCRRRLRFHDYDQIFAIPQLYEALFYDTLKCNSPERVTDLLGQVLADSNDSFEDLRVLDVGAGNGMVGEMYRECGAATVVGIDILPEARRATLRDRPDVYQDYLIADLTDLDEPIEERLRNQRLNTLSLVAALGFGDIPAPAFLKALDLLQTPGWLAFNIKEAFLDDAVATAGFAQLIRDLASGGIIRLESYRRYRHRFAVSGKPLYYVALIAPKLRDVPDELLCAGGPR